MNTKALKQKILDLAIHGKLLPLEKVEKIRKEEPASGLLEKIRAEKQEKIAKGELKKDKNDSFIFVGDDKRHYEKFADGSVKDIEDEIPFDVPDGWSWCRLGEITNVKSSKRVFEKDYVSTGIPFYRSLEVGQLYRNEKILQSLYITKEHYEELKRNYGVPSCGDILITSVGTIGNTWICDEREFYYKDGNVTQICKSEFFNSKYMNYFFHSNLMSKQVSDTVGGSAYNALTIEKLKNLFNPLPPISEQQLIVAEIEKIFTQIDLLEQNKTDLQTAIKQAKSKILDLAIHGKLVSQDPNDESASVLLEKIRAEKEEKIAKGELKRDKNDSYIYKGSDNCHYEKFVDGTEEEIEVPFDLPEGWNWGRLNDIKNYIGDGDWIESKDQSTFGIRLLQTGNIGFGIFRDKKDSYHYISEETFNNLNCNEIFPGDILISRLPEPVGRACIVPTLPNRLITAVDCTILRINNRILLDIFFIYYTQSAKYLDLIKANCTGTTRLRISRGNLEGIMIPIPPLNEQTRIVNKITELFSILDKISLNLV